MDVLISRSEAREKNLRLYFTGNPCIHGHVAYRRVSNLTCEECNRIKARKLRAANPELARQKNRHDYASHQSDRKAVVAKWREANPEKVKGYTYKCQARRSPAITSPLAEANAVEIRKIYANRPEGHDVDHIIPLLGKTVCGLHVPWNLQYLPSSENRAKGNKLI